MANYTTQSLLIVTLVLAALVSVKSEMRFNQELLSCNYIVHFSH